MHDPFLLVENHNNTELQHYKIVSFGTRHNKAHIITQLKQDRVSQTTCDLFSSFLVICHKLMISYAETAD